MNAYSEISPAALDGCDPAELGQLTATVERILPAIEEFWRYDGRDDAARRRPGWLARLDVPLPEDGGGIGAVVADLADVVIPNGARVSEPGWSSFITTGPTTSAVAAWLAAAAAGSQRYAVQAFNTLERVALDWVAQLCGIPAACQGVFSSGGSTANLVALGAARQWAFERRGHDVSADGLPPAVRARVYASGQAHNTIQRATAVLGLGRAGTRRIACDARQRIDVAALRAAIAADERDGVVPVAVVGTAGTTDTGAIDPLGDLAEIAREHGAWFHVDGAYGLIAAASPALRPAFAAVADADSVIVDPHKWLATGAGCAATYVRDAGLLTRAFAQGAATYYWRARSPPGRMMRSSSSTAPGSPTGTWVSSCLRPAAACWPGRCCANWAAPVSRPGWSATSGSPATWPSGPASIRGWNCCSSRSCQSSASATPPATPSTPRSSCGCAAPPARYHLRRSSEATWRSGPALSTPAPG